MNKRIRKRSNGDFVVVHEEDCISTSYNISIRFVFIGMLLTSCEGWSVMGYALDESQENSIEIDE